MTNNFNEINTLSKEVAKIVDKVWGKEYIFEEHDSDRVFSKILSYNKGFKSSLHFHLKKNEKFIIFSGSFSIRCFKPSSGGSEIITPKIGDIIDIPVGCAHEVFCLEAGDIYEFATIEDPSDSYRLNSSGIHGFNNK